MGHESSLLREHDDAVPLAAPPLTCDCGPEGGAAIAMCGDRNPLGSPGEVGERADASLVCARYGLIRRRLLSGERRLGGADRVRIAREFGHHPEVARPESAYGDKPGQ